VRPGEDRLPEGAVPNMPFAGVLGITFVRYEAAEVRARMAWRPELCTANDVMHGGAIMSLADTSGAACAFLNLPPGAQGTTTIESKTNLVRAVRGGTIEACSRPLHVGRSMAVIETEVRDDTDRLVAKVTQTQLVLTG
jgi:uncharacterized protein (TIGR00369 family)